MKLVRTLLTACVSLSLASCVSVERRADAPIAAAPKSDAKIFAVAANPLATEAGMAVLRRGGSAVDAAIAMQAMLSLAEPQSSGIGGGAFLTYYDGKTKRVSIFDGRETAPAGATPDMFLDDSGKPLTYAQAVLSGRATGVLGAVKMLALAHSKHGVLPWRTLFGDAERTARDGFIVSPRLGRFLASGAFPESNAPDVLKYFARQGGGLLRPGDRLRNPAFAEFLGRLAAEGPDALYTGETARRIVAKVHEGELASTMTLADLAAYRPIEREALCGRYRVYVVCVPPPPSSGVGMLQLLMLLERTDIASRGPTDPRAWMLFAEASRLMYADRDQYVGDPAFVSVPVKGMIDPAYVDARAKLIGDRAGAAPPAGQPAGATVAGRDRTLEPMGTSHFVVGDAQGNVVSMTTTVESIFGTGRMVDGFFLNNQMTDFSFAPRDAQGRPMANAVAAGKRPRSSMTPLIMLDAQGGFAGALGSAGGNSILAYVGKSMVGAVDWGLPMQDALALPNLVARGSSFQGEVTKFSPALLSGLRALGIELRPGQGEDSGLQGVIVRSGVVDGGYDPRREGRFLIEAAPAR
ncbi:gamma-glutamyltransferase family protein [Sphingomonas aliaeris]|uniref:Gamma-glutamyltransferase family protein n=1 Tax=Sphingomonas aliaeris TaxID=2759526 RepID=A0A974S5B9_9SPHN|nr:gamma-glutamyltransferase family protein [Sphingomonas aliaeris]QQV78414.1 gamma-glutamyltransferase family protein [Sphingomonas aliaeris]